MAVETTEKEVVIKLREPFMTNGKIVGPGKVKVPVSTADDLMRRQHEFDEDKRRQLANNGENIDALHGDTIRG